MNPNPQLLVVSKPEPQRIWLIPIIVMATVSLLGLNSIARSLQPTLLANNFLDGMLKYQFLALGLTAVVVLLGFWLGPKSFRRYFAIGNLNAAVEPVGWIGLNPKLGEGWWVVGRNFAMVITAVTLFFIYYGTIRGNTIETQNLKYLPWILIFAASNAFVEEMITRYSLVSALDGLVPLSRIYWISAILFGAVHYFGVPGGIAGVLMAGFLGWLLAKSVGETQGIFWAWLIHALQDVVIFTGFFFQRL